MKLAVVTCCLTVAACGDEPARLAWGLGVQTFDARALGLGTDHPADPFLDAIVTTPHLTVPTYDGSGQAVHPDVLVEGSGAIMAFTPYPFSNNRFENPSLLRTLDGTRFESVPEASPLVPAPPIDHNDDPDLRRDPVTGEYELLYLETLRPERQTLVALRTTDLATWARHDAIVYDLAHGDSFIVSPAALVVDGVTHLYYVDLIPTARLVELVSTDGRTWDKTLAKPVAIDLGVVTPWHVDVLRGEQGFAMLISGYDAEFVHQDLYLATSPDLVSWTLAPTPLLAHTDPALGVESLYRSTGVISGDKLVVWYSMQYAP
ncbi:MAG: hypothetical protein H6Q90_5260 [Deltaproteobacteria bacterium]|nr:hypothetical protein [Deltaproteobacteria bacterium]